MTVTVETPDGPVTGSTVYEVGAQVVPGGQAITGSVAQYGYQGEAAVVDLGEGRYMFASAHPFGEAIYRTAPEVFSRFDSEDRVAWLTHFQTLGAPITVREEFYPRFVTFGDIEDPLTADIFEAGEMAQVFGPGYAFASVTLEVVEAPMDVGRIEEVLPWLGGFGLITLMAIATASAKHIPNFRPKPPTQTNWASGRFQRRSLNDPLYRTLHVHLSYGPF